MQIGAHVHADDPLSAARERAADSVQFFLSDPQGWKKPQPHPQATELADAGIDVYIHAPYVLNVASLNNRIRIPSRKVLGQHTAAAAETGARGLVVHGGHVRQGEDPAEGLANWRKLFERRGEQGDFEVPHWVAISCYIAIGLGTLTGGWKIIETMGSRITKLDQHQGFSASAGGSVMLFGASLLGIPVSTTHTITGAVIGAGVARRASAVRWGVAQSVIMAWIITIPASATVARAFASS